MSPASNRHSALQSLFARLPGDALARGEALVECSLGTIERIKTADVDWTSAANLSQQGSADPYP